jgi:hypothetical protein
LAIHLVVHIARVAGQRRVTEIAAVCGYDAPHDRFVLESRLPLRPITEGGKP